MKILYISPENTAGVLSLWKQAHEEAANECRFITFYSSAAGFEEDICLNLPLISAESWFTKTRNKIYQQSRGQLGDQTEKEGNPPIWQPENLAHQLFFSFRDWLWKFKIEPAIRKYKLDEYDIFHFEWGLDFYRHQGFAKRMKALGKPIICHYHGQDMRTRGILLSMDKMSDLNLTNETDLLERHPKIEYLPLPFNVNSISERTTINSPIRICHATTNRFYKGSEFIIEVCENLSAKIGFEFILVENLPHREAMKVKSSCDINIDQISETGGWGYGMNSVEAMAMDLCCFTYLVPECEKYFPGHPFINVSKNNLEKKIIEFITQPELIKKYAKQSRAWVLANHHYENVRDKLYKYYSTIGIHF